jgi:hypothetical protein
MDRPIVYPGQVPADTDALTGWMATMRAFSGALYAIMGTGTVFDGLVVSPGTGLTVSVGAGSITAHVAADTAVYGSLGIASDTVMKQGINHAATTLPASGAFTAPTTAGQSVNILIQAAFSETDTNPALLPYMNAANPSVPYGGPGNNGASQPTLRQESVALSYVAGTPAATGSQTTPAATTGNVPIAVVTIAYGQSSITSASISVPGNAPIIPWKLPQLTPGFSRMQVFGTSGTLVVPNGVAQAKVTVVGGGGGGGGADNTGWQGGGGGAGGFTQGVFSLTPGQQVSITVGSGGAGEGPGATGGTGGTSSFGACCSATGGQGGGSSKTNAAGGSGGMGYGGALNFGGGMGGDAYFGTYFPGNGAPGPWGGGGRAAGALAGFNGQAPGAGGGGVYGGPSASQSGGSGAAGIVIVEY